MESGDDFTVQVGASSESLGFDRSDEGTTADAAPTQRSITYDVLDNLGETAYEYVYAGNGLTADEIGDYTNDHTPSSSSSIADRLRSETTTAYNAQGIEYSSDHDPVDQTTGSGDYLPAEETQTLYDDDGNLTATIDPSGRITATTYDDDGNDIADYQGQAVMNGDPGCLEEGSVWAFSNLSPNSALTYDVYVHAEGADYTDYSVTYAGNSAGVTPDHDGDPTAPTLDGWTFLGTVTVLRSQPLG